MNMRKGGGVREEEGRVRRRKRSKRSTEKRKNVR